MPVQPVQLHAGTLADFDDSMAKEIEDALNQLHITNGLPPLPSTPDSVVRVRRLLFIAIARGVINHLKEKEQAFHIEFDTAPHVSTTPDIDVRS